MALPSTCTRASWICAATFVCSSEMRCGRLCPSQPDNPRDMVLYRRTVLPGALVLSGSLATVLALDLEYHVSAMSSPFRVAARLILGFRVRSAGVLGIVVEGEIDRLGPGVTSFRQGDQVFWVNPFGAGAYAEFSCEGWEAACDQAGESAVSGSRRHSLCGLLSADPPFLESGWSRGGNARVDLRSARRHRLLGGDGLRKVKCGALDAKAGSAPSSSAGVGNVSFAERTECGDGSAGRDRRQHY